MRYFLKIYTLLFFSIYAYGSVDIDTPNKGEQQMIQSLRYQIQNDSLLSSKKIIIGSGHSGCEAFKAPLASTHRILLLWQWLDALKEIANDIILIIPKHAIDERFSTLIERGQKIITIDGVLHGKTIEYISHYSAPEGTIDPRTNFIVMLAGDTEQSDGSWIKYNREMLSTLIQQLPKEQKLLFLNGPRTGKYLENGSQVDAEAHRTTTDYITQHVIQQNQPLWVVEDFKYGQPSLWDAALKFCFSNTNVGLILPGESTSMICEALSLGIKPIIYQHNAMTTTSIAFVQGLISENQAIPIEQIDLKALPTTSNFYQEPLPDQILNIINELKRKI